MYGRGRGRWKEVYHYYDYPCIHVIKLYLNRIKISFNTSRWSSRQIKLNALSAFPVYMQKLYKWSKNPSMESASKEFRCKWCVNEQTIHSNNLSIYWIWLLSMIDCSIIRRYISEIHFYFFPPVKNFDRWHHVNVRRNLSYKNWPVLALHKFYLMMVPFCFLYFCVLSASLLK